ncbi:hypothetical protein DWX10_22945 [Clostridium sp. AF18-27]|uniref:hypothetical protein n=1 Tax=Enterocloster lavalensis TaxID=460384 RepID=UPI000E51678E|nr:hypothetical protein [Enterocloster lavalensis]RHR48802.1 hypothetical protein DWX10_22945 [Clostridium sp. AF18-27]
MAKKNIHFYEVALYDEYGVKVSPMLYKNIILDILERIGIKQTNHISLDITPFEESMHLIFDAYDYNEGRLFGRFSKQMPKNTLVHHDYTTYKDSEVLPGEDERERGIEKYTYGMLNYDSGIWAFISARGAADENVLKTFVEKYKPGYTLEILAIPNEKGIDNIYSGKDPEISKVEIEVPLPNADVLERLFQWNDTELLNSLSENSLKISAILKAEPRHNIAEEPNVVKKIIDAVKDGQENYNKAKMYAKARTVKAREYNFFEDNFAYPIDVASYHMQSNERVYYTPDELVDIYRQNIVMAFNDSRGILDLFGNNRK